MHPLTYYEKKRKRPFIASPLPICYNTSKDYKNVIAVFSVLSPFRVSLTRDGLFICLSLRLHPFPWNDRF